VEGEQAVYGSQPKKQVHIHCCTDSVVGHDLRCRRRCLGRRPKAELRGGWQPGPDIYHPSRVIVRFSDVINTNAAVDSIERLGYSVDRIADFKPTAAFPNGVRFGIVELPEEVSSDTAISRLSNAPEILYAERDYIRYKTKSTWRPHHPQRHSFRQDVGLHNENCQHKDPEMSGNPVDNADIDAPEAWAVHTGSDEIIVAVIDTGCYIDHPDLAATSGSTRLR